MGQLVTVSQVYIQTSDGSSRTGTFCQTPIIVGYSNCTVKGELLFAWLPSVTYMPPSETHKCIKPIPKVIRILKECYILPLQNRAPFTMYPIIVSGYVYPFWPGYEIKPKYFQDHRTDNLPKLLVRQKF